MTVIPSKTILNRTITQDGQLTDPTSVTITVTNPEGTILITDKPATRITTGKYVFYHTFIDTGVSGQYVFTWTITFPDGYIANSTDTIDTITITLPITPIITEYNSNYTVDYESDILNRLPEKSAFQIEGNPANDMVKVAANSFTRMEDLVFIVHKMRYIDYAQGKYLDYWGDMLGVPRSLGTHKQNILETTGKEAHLNLALGSDIYYSTEGMKAYNGASVRSSDEWSSTLYHSFELEFYGLYEDEKVRMLNNTEEYLPVIMGDDCNVTFDIYGESGRLLACIIGLDVDGIITEVGEPLEISLTGEKKRVTLEHTFVGADTVYWTLLFKSREVEA